MKFSLLNVQGLSDHKLPYFNEITKHDHISIRLNNGIILTYNDVRKFGYFSIISNGFIESAFVE